MLLANPEAARLELDKADDEESLLRFIEDHWHILEPGTEFKKGWVLRAWCSHLEQVTAGNITRMVANVPPGFMKSLTMNVFWPAWEWGPKNRPWLRYIKASYSEKLTFRDNRKMTMLIQSPEYQAKWGDRFKLVKVGEELVTNDKTGAAIATSVSGYSTGERGERFLVDDPHNVQDAASDVKRERDKLWFAESIPLRPANDESFIGLIMQRVHDDDITGLVQRKMPDYLHFCIPMEFEEETRCKTYVKGKLFFEDPRTVEGELAWPERYSRKYLEEQIKPALRSVGGSYAEAAQLQQRPSPRGGGLFKLENLKRAKTIEEPVMKRVRAWDLAGSTMKRSAFTATVRLSRGKSGMIYIEHAFHFRGTPGAVEAKIKTYAQADIDAGLHARIILPQDPAQAGKAQRISLSRGALAGFNFLFVRESPLGGKEARAGPLAAQWEYGNVTIIEGDWNDEFLREMETFPVGRYRDQVDAASLGYLSLVGQVREPPPSPGICFTAEPVASPEANDGMGAVGYD